MLDLATRERELLVEWEPRPELDEELRAPARERHPDRDERAELMRRWFADREPRLVTLLEFCQGWRATWRDAGASPERDHWVDAFRADGERPAAFVTPPPERALTDSDGDALCDRAGHELADCYAAFRAEMALRRRELLGVVAEDEPAPLEAPAATPLWVRVVTEGLSTRAFHYPRLEAFHSDARGGGLFSVLPDLETGIARAASEHVGTRDHGPSLTASVSWEPDDGYVLADLHLGTTVLRPLRDAALRTLSEPGARCFYLQFDDAVVLSATGAFDGVPLGMLTALRIAAGARADGGRFRLPTVGTEMSQIVRDEDAVRIHPSRFARHDWERVRDLVVWWHPHLEVRRA